MLDLELPIDTPRLTLREITHADTKAYAAIQFEKGVENFIAMRLTAQRKTPRIECGVAIVEKTTDDVIGYAEVAVNDMDDIELRCFIFPEYQSQNYATEACIHLCSAVFARGYRYISASTTKQNLPAHILLKKMGMVMIGRKDDMEYWSLERTKFIVAEINYKKALQNATRAITA
jgi:RimJ/RimL family protein N-acetyltransferase